MKIFLSVLTVLALTAAPALAETVLLQENFDGTVGSSVADGVNWTGPTSIVRSSDLLDSGNSATWADGSTAWPAIVHAFANVPNATDIYTLTATLYSPTTGGTDAELHIRSSSDPVNTLQGVSICYGSMDFGVINQSTIKIKPQPTAATDVKLVLQGTTSDYYYRAHGATDWIHAGQKTGLGWSIAAYDQIAICGHGGNAGGIDSILLTTSVPEPATMVLLSTSIFGLLAYAWRKRK